MNKSMTLLTLALTYAGCANKNVKTKLDSIYQEATLIHCSLDSLRQSISKSWDEVTTSLDNGLPDETPEEERANMLKVRNASLIRMFETYRDLADSTKQQVDSAEILDQKIAQKIAQHRKRLEILESERHRLLYESQSSKKDINFKNYPNLSDMKPTDCSHN